MGRTLVLNASYEPLHIISWQRAIHLLFQGKIEVLVDSTMEIRSVNLTLKLPSVVRLKTYIKHRSTTSLIKFSRMNVFLRDDFNCQYCKKKFPFSLLTLDHVTPVSHGGLKNFENIVTACRTCNQKKGGRTPEQAGMKLKQSPQTPHWLPPAPTLSVASAPEEWLDFLSPGRQGSIIQATV